MTKLSLLRSDVHPKQYGPAALFVCVWVDGRALRDRLLIVGRGAAKREWGKGGGGK